MSIWIHQKYIRVLESVGVCEIVLEKQRKSISRESVWENVRNRNRESEKESNKVSEWVREREKKRRKKVVFMV